MMVEEVDIVDAVPAVQRMERHPLLSERHQSMAEGGAQRTTVEDVSGKMVAVSYGRLGCDAPIKVEVDAGTFPMLVLTLVLNGTSDVDMPANGAVEAGLSRALKLASSPNGMPGMDMPARGGVEVGAPDEPGLMRGGRWHRGRSSSLLTTWAVGMVCRGRLGADVEVGIPIKGNWDSSKITCHEVITLCVVKSKH
jgi:hypothetical protein